MELGCEMSADVEEVSTGEGDRSGVPAYDLTVIMVSFNTRELTLKAIATLLSNAGEVTMRVVVVDNASADRSADAIAAQFPQVELIRSGENIGFARANNLAAETVRTEHLLLLNPDTETRDGAIAKLLAFARAHPGAGIVGGRTVFPDGSLNPASCANRMTCWSLLCSALGLSRAFPASGLFNSEQIGGWKRTEMREVDIVVGCFFLIRTDLWKELGGFDPRYFMYGEETDLCLRAKRAGFRPMITPEAEIMHLVGASTPRREDKLLPLLKARATLVREHWPPALVPVGLSLMWLWSAVRRAAAFVGARESALWRTLWHRRKEWLAGY